MCISGGLLFMWGIVLNYPFAVSVAASQKTLISALENALFVGQNENRPLWRSSLSQEPRVYPIWPRFNKLCHDQGQT
jgi:hypothetical protein